jgi:hypothetical protein
MFIYHAIVSPNDRYFNTSVGNWQTNGVWDPNTYGAYSKVIRFDFSVIGTDGQMTLLYPHLKPKTGKVYTLFFDSIRVSSGQSITIEWILTDGNILLTGSAEVGLTGYHDRILTTPRIPNNWVKENSSFQIILHETGILPLQWAIDNPTLYFLYETQHLPVIGAG